MRAMTVRVDDSVWDQIESARGPASRNRFVVEAIEAKLGLAPTLRPPGRPRGDTPQPQGFGRIREDPFGTESL